MHRCAACPGRWIRQGGALRDWRCNGCGGRAVRLSRLAAAVPDAFALAVADAVAAGGRRGSRRCPLCQMHWVGSRIRHGSGEWTLDHCDHCAYVWFDGGEAEAVVDGAAPSRLGPQDGPPRDAIPRGVAAAEDVAARSEFPRFTWSTVPLYLGLATISAHPLWSRPVVSSALAVAILAGGAAGLFAGEEIFASLGLVPREPFRNGGLTVLTSFFLHASWFHLLANLWYLLLAGPMVEDDLGPLAFLGLVAASALAGDLAYVLATAGSPVPVVGASGGISGVIAYLALSFPHARVRALYVVHLSYAPLDVDMSARTTFGAWIALQIAGALFCGGEGVAHVAHLGGAAAGLAAWLAGPMGRSWLRRVTGRRGAS